MTSGVPGTHVTAASLTVVILTGVLGTVATLFWWERSDQTV